MVHFKSSAKSNSTHLLVSMACIFGFVGMFRYTQIATKPNALSSLEHKTLSGTVFRKNTSSSGYQTLHVKLQNCYSNNQKSEACGNVMLTLETSSVQYALGDELVFNVNLETFTQTNNPGSFNALFYYTTHQYVGRAFCIPENIEKIGNSTSIFIFFAKWQEHLAEYIQSKLPESVAGLAVGLLVGAKGDIERETLQAFSDTGAMHVLAVSGMHVGIILYLVQQFFLLFSRWINRKQAILLSITFIWAFGLLSGASSAVMRAVVMFSIIAIGMLVNRKSNGLNSLFISAIVLLLYNPFYLFDVGFQLSYAAMFGIFLLYKPLQSMLSFDQKILQWFWDGTAMGIAATVATFPFILFWFGQFPNYFLISNLIVMLLGTVSIIVLVALICGSWIPWVNSLLVLLCLVVLYLLTQGIVLIGQIPGSVTAGFELSIIAFIALGLTTYFVAYTILVRKKLDFVGYCSFGAVLLVLSFNRFIKFETNALHIFVSPTLCGSIQVDNQTVFFYQKNSKNTRQIIQDAQRSFGIRRLKTIALKNQNNIQIGDDTLLIDQQKNGWMIRYKNLSWEYKQKGIPSATEDQRLLAQYLQMALRKNFKPFVTNL
jgi:competence protein ComEC